MILYESVASASARPRYYTLTTICNHVLQIVKYVVIISSLVMSSLIFRSVDAYKKAIAFNKSASADNTNSIIDQLYKAISRKLIFNFLLVFAC